jgi:hypothetical protein
LALLLHAVALYFLRFPVSPAIAGRKAALEVVLLVEEAPSTAGFRDVRRGGAIAGTVASAPHRAGSPTLPGEVDAPAPPPSRDSQSAISAAQLLESARWIIREEVKNAGRGAIKGDEHPVDTVEAKLAKALRAPSAGEKHLDGGLVKITTIYGVTYCLKATPDPLRDGPVEPISIPTTCP